MLTTWSPRLPRRVPSWLLPPLAGESELEHHIRQSQEYFNEQIAELPDWWERIGEPFNFSNAKVLDLECAQGALSISVACAGAAEVLALDPVLEIITFASDLVRRRFPELARKIQFSCDDVTELPHRQYFDFVISKDSFQYIDQPHDPQSTVNAAARLLKPGGKLILGFSPLYYSPLGDNYRTGLPLPWLHAILPERWVLKSASKKQGKRIDRMSDLGLNKLTPADFRSLFPAWQWRTITLRYNRGLRSLVPLFSPRRFMPLMSLLRKMPFLEKYFTVSIYAVFELIGTTPAPGSALPWHARRSTEQDEALTSS